MTSAYDNCSGVACVGVDGANEQDGVDCGGVDSEVGGGGVVGGTSADSKGSITSTWSSIPITAGGLQTITGYDGDSTLNGDGHGVGEVGDSWRSRINSSRGGLARDFSGVVSGVCSILRFFARVLPATGGVEMSAGAEDIAGVESAVVVVEVAEEAFAACWPRFSSHAALRLLFRARLDLLMCFFVVLTGPDGGLHVAYLQRNVIYSTPSLVSNKHLAHAPDSRQCW